MAWPAARSRASRSRTTACRNPTRPSFTAGNYARPHPQFYRDTVLKDTRAPDHGDLDIVETVLPAAKKRGMQGPLLDARTCGGRRCRASSEVAEVDLQGRRAGHALPDEPGRASLLDGAGHRPLLVLRHRRHPLLQRAERSAAQCDRLQPLPADRLVAHDLLLRTPQEGREGARHRLRAGPGGVPEARRVREGGAGGPSGRATATSSSSGGCWSSTRRSSPGTGSSTSASTRSWPRCVRP